MFLKAITVQGPNADLGLVLWESIAPLRVRSLAGQGGSRVV